MSKCLRYSESCIGDEVVIGDHTYPILESGEAVCLGLEGELPKGSLPDETYRYADGGSLDGTHALGVEYDDTPPTIFVGSWISRQKTFGSQSR